MNQVTVENKGDSRFYASTKDSLFILDTEGQGANPIDGLLASLSACVGTMARDFLKTAGRAASGFTIKAEGTMADDNSRLSAIRLIVEMGAIELDESEEKALLNHMERCKIRQTLKPGCEIQITLQRQALTSH